MNQRRSIDAIAVRIIKATKQLEKPEQKKKRVCAYARISTDDQESSYKAQVEHYTNYIRKHPDMEFVGMYADEGISGTQTKNRKELNRIHGYGGGNSSANLYKNIPCGKHNT